MLMVGVVSAAAPGFVEPSDDDYVSGDMDVEWTNPLNDPDIYIQYREGNCNPSGTWMQLGPFLSSVTETTIDTFGLDDVEHCLRLRFGGTTYDFLQFNVDNIAPDADFDVTGDLIIYETLNFDASASTDGGSGIASYEWDFGDGDTGTGEYTTHVYEEADDYDVVLTVTDNVGNKGVAIMNLEIEDLPLETETFSYEAGILGIAPTLDEEFDTGLTGVACSVVPITDEITNIEVDSSGSSCLIDETSDIPYDERGVRSIIIKATDGSETKYYSVEIIVYTWWINLEEGWNLISIPMMPEDTSIDSVLGGIQESIVDDGDYTIFQFDATYGSSGRWYKAKPTSTWTGTLDDIFPGYGYWIKMEDEDVLKGFGDITPGIGGSLISVEVANGWNLIGHYGLKELKLSKALTSLIDGINKHYDAVATRDSVGWWPVPSMDKYKGYWMTAKFLPDGVTSYTPSQDAINYLLI